MSSSSTRRERPGQRKSSEAPTGKLHGHSSEGSKDVSRTHPRRARTRSLGSSRAGWLRIGLRTAILWSCACVPMSSAQSATPGEYQLKAAFLFNFAKFIDWPTTSFTNPQDRFSICILGADPFGSGMDELLQGK